MSPTKKTARVAGILYLSMIIFGVFSLMYVPGELIDWNNPELTAKNIIASKALFNAGFISSLLSIVVWLFLSFALYELLKPVSKKIASLIVIFVTAGACIMCTSSLNQYAVLQLLSGKGYLDVFEPNQLHTLSMFFIELYNGGDLIGTIFFGLWLLPLGYLVYKSNYLPRTLGVLLVIGGFAYIGEFFGRALYSDYYSSGIGGFITLPADVGELGFCIWLLVKGVKISTVNAFNSEKIHVKED